MKAYYTMLLLMTCILLSCSVKIYPTNGETIYKTGRNIKGEKLLNRKSSRIKIATSCKTCHGATGKKMRNFSITFRDISNTKNFSTPYSDRLFYRFLDEDIKSNGNRANIGVIWKMSDSDKKDLLHYLKQL
jgi:cytochrome c553